MCRNKLTEGQKQTDVVVLVQFLRAARPRPTTKDVEREMLGESEGGRDAGEMLQLVGRSCNV